MKKGEIIELEIADLAFGGKSIAYLSLETDNLELKDKKMVVFVDKGIPGQKVKVRITKKKKRYMEAKLLEILERSPLEQDSRLYGNKDGEGELQEVSGAPWATLPIEKQMEFKQKQVFDLFKKFADIELKGIFQDYLPSPKTWEYRNKMEYSFGYREESFEEIPDEKDSQKMKKIWTHFGFALGSKKRGQYWLVENLEKPSGLFDAEFEAFLPEIRKFCKTSGALPYNAKTNEGFFRHLVVRKSFQENKYLICLVTTSKNKDTFDMEGFKTLLCEKFKDKVGGIFWQISDEVSDNTQRYTERTLIYGNETMIEQINELHFQVSLDSFFQTNIFSAEKLYNRTIEYATDGKIKGKNIFDLFCGTGTMTQLVAKKCPLSHVFGVEIVESAVEDACVNAKLNKLENLEFFCEDVGKFLKTHPGFKEKIEVIILDPPRAGIAPKTLDRVIALKSKKIVYVSCNPATFARDTKILESNGYSLKKLSLVDQFPHTSHIECVGMFVFS
ncbi:23S rRNA (uracil(1939)-C(5))-methyltransferase RlmD [Candidatus Gracilibacteria bacterium]|nr:23S rRNA (uracil(1939)-C(5))-methyltransferase RlmD [Candidatus Gracilibacteria bacterium]